VRFEIVVGYGTLDFWRMDPRQMCIDCLRFMIHIQRRRLPFGSLLVFHRLYRRFHLVSNPTTPDVRLPYLPFIICDALVRRLNFFPSFGICFLNLDVIQNLFLHEALSLATSNFHTLCNLFTGPLCELRVYLRR